MKNYKTSRDLLVNKVRSQLQAEIGMALTDNKKFTKPLAKKLYSIINTYLRWLDREKVFDYMERKWSRADELYIPTKEQLRIKEEGGINGVG